MTATTSTESAQERVIAVEADGIPNYLKMRPQWVVWRLEERDGKPTKVPYDPITGARASTTDLTTWGAFAEALATYHSDVCQGVGFVFCSADPFVGLDFDKCRNPETGEVDPGVLEYIAKFKDPHVEVSVSGTGVHLITRGKLKGGSKRGNREVYDQDRFFCMTVVAI